KKNKQTFGEYYTTIKNCTHSLHDALPIYRNVETARSVEAHDHRDRPLRCLLDAVGDVIGHHRRDRALDLEQEDIGVGRCGRGAGDRKSTRLNSSHVKISYAVFCLKKKNAT